MFLTMQNVSRSEFASLVGVTDGAVKLWLKGERKIPNTISILVRYFIIRDINIKELRV